MSEIAIGLHTVELSSQDKVLFPDAGLTKGDLVDYYHRIADEMVPYLRGRPLALRRYPDGIDQEGFVQQEAPDYFPEWIDRATVKKEDGTITHAVCNNPATLVYLANQGVVTPHVWLSRTDRPEHPDRMIFDLDPPDSGSKTESRFHKVRQAARVLKKLLDDLGLTAYVMTTGSSGLHVVVPLDQSADFDTVREFANSIAGVLTRRHPEELTVEQRKAKRQDRIFIDVLRNAYGQTTVPPYAVRARPCAPVATPLDWDEVGQGDMRADRYTIDNIFRRLGQKHDPWGSFDNRVSDIRGSFERLRQIRADDG